MDDLISRQDVINKCRERLYESALNNVGYECKADEVFADIAQNRIKTWLNEVSSAQQWTPCSEGLPKKEGVYFVTFNKSCLLENELTVMDAVWRDGQWQYGVLESYKHSMPKLVVEPIEELKVIAWMPLPEPYEP